MARNRWVIFALLVGGLLSSATSGHGQASGRARVIELSGIIDPTTAGFLQSQIAAAQDEVDVLIIELDTPGGLDVSMRSIISDMLASRIPTVVWIAPRGARAASAGTFITYAANLAYMADATEVGAASPVNLGGEGSETLEKKATNDAVAFITELARLRGRNVEWAEDAVREAASLGATDAVEMNVVDGIASTLDDLLEAMDGQRVDVAGEVTVTMETWDAAAQKPSVDVERVGMNLFQRLLHFATQPEVAFLLVSLGTLAIILEVYTSGIGLAGILGAISLVLGFYGLTVLPTNWAAVALIILGMVFFLVELHVPGIGVWTVGGAAALVAGGLLLFSGASPAVALSPWAIALVIAVTVPFFLFAMTAALRVRLRPSVIGPESLVGMTGEARTDISSEGTVMTKGALWRARAAGPSIPAGSRVRVERTEGLLLVVSPHSEEDR
ncbi:MAG: NfeD family protein [Actinomycetota bacterium]